MRNPDDFLNALALLLWGALCTACGLWFLHLGNPWRCTQRLAGHQHKTFAYKNNVAAYLEYGRRMRGGFRFQVRSLCGENADLIKRFNKGEYTQDRAAFEADTSAFCNSVLDSIQQWDGQQVPDIMEKSHAKISACHRLCYKSVQTLREAYGSEGAEKVRLVSEAEEKLKQAWMTGEDGVKLHETIWANTPT